MLRTLARAAVLGLGLMAVSCTSEEPAAEPAGQPSATRSAPLGEAAAYPDLYRALDLPVLPGAVVTSSGRQVESLRDGLSIRLMTKQTMPEVRTFYQEAMTGLGWTPGASGPGAAALNLPVANVTFTRDQLMFSATITAAETGSTVVLSVFER